MSCRFTCPPQIQNTLPLLPPLAQEESTIHYSQKNLSLIRSFLDDLENHSTSFFDFNKIAGFLFQVPQATFYLLDHAPQAVLPPEETTYADLFAALGGLPLTRYLLTRLGSGYYEQNPQQLAAVLLILQQQLSPSKFLRLFKKYFLASNDPQVLKTWAEQLFHLPVAEQQEGWEFVFAQQKLDLRLLRDTKQEKLFHFCAEHPIQNLPFSSLFDLSFDLTGSSRLFYQLWRNCTDKDLFPRLVAREEEKGHRLYGGIILLLTERFPETFALTEYLPQVTRALVQLDVPPDHPVWQPLRAFLTQHHATFVPTIQQTYLQLFLGELLRKGQAPSAFLTANLFENFDLAWFGEAEIQILEALKKKAVQQQSRTEDPAHEHGLALFLGHYYEKNGQPALAEQNFHYFVGCKIEDEKDYNTPPQAYRLIYAHLSPWAKRLLKEGLQTQEEAFGDLRLEQWLLGLGLYSPEESREQLFSLLQNNFDLKFSRYQDVFETHPALPSNICERCEKEFAKHQTKDRLSTLSNWVALFTAAADFEKKELSLAGAEILLENFVQNSNYPIDISYRCFKNQLHSFSPHQIKKYLLEPKQCPITAVTKRELTRYTYLLLKAQILKKVRQQAATLLNG